MNATSVEFNRFIIDENGIQSNLLEFGSMYFGGTKTLEAYLVNNTPKKYQFNCRIKLGL